MIGMRTILEVADNSGARRLSCILPRGGDKGLQAGLGDVLQQWIGTGPNPEISGEQLGQVLGGDMLGQIASQLGVDPGQAAGQLAQVLPGLIDGLTPSGQAPEGGFGNAGDLLGALAGMLQKK